jgi:peptidoglycan hydrolase CwlO-like protein
MIQAKDVVKEFFSELERLILRPAQDAGLTKISELFLYHGFIHSSKEWFIHNIEEAEYWEEKFDAAEEERNNIDRDLQDMEAQVDDIASDLSNITDKLENADPDETARLVAELKGRIEDLESATGWRTKPTKKKAA